MKPITIVLSILILFAVLATQAVAQISGNTLTRSSFITSIVAARAGGGAVR